MSKTEQQAAADARFNERFQTGFFDAPRRVRVGLASGVRTVLDDMANDRGHGMRKALDELKAISRSGRPRW